MLGFNCLFSGSLRGPSKLEKQDDKYVLLHDVNAGQGTRVNVVRTASHPEFGGLEEFWKNDIALVFFAGKVAGPYLKLGGPYPQPNSKIMAAGFGVIDGNDTISKVLNKVELNVGSVEECKAKVGSLFNSSGQFCTVNNHGRSTCSGDSGGPLWVDVDSSPRLLGISSYGSALCGDKDSFSFFTFVTPFIPWINQEIAKFENEQKNNASTPIRAKE
ncbi:hypothetical protein BGZ72_006043 [Mortierella alpina]|nr:hypothetical protein BGZ72_006043 [Mortierella alpina]